MTSEIKTPSPGSPQGLGAHEPATAERTGAAGSTTGARHLVVPVDASPASRRAVGVARTLARGLGVGVQLVTASFDQDDAEDLAQLRATAEELGLDDAECEVVLDRFPAQAIVEVAQRAGVEAVCMATFAHGVMPHTLGGVADEVVHDTVAPVVLVGPDVPVHDPLSDGTTDRPIVVMLDGSEAAASIIPLVAAWAGRLGAPVHLATVHPGDGTGCPDPVMQDAVAVAASGGAAATAHHLERADVAGTLLAFARSLGAGLLALSPTGHGGAMNRALGYVATDVVRGATVPVLVRRATRAAGPTGAQGPAPRRDIVLCPPRARPAIADPATTVLDDTGLEVMDRDECLRKLEGAAVARVGVTSGALPVVVPVNITLAELDPQRGPEVVLRCVERSNLARALTNTVIAVETDAIEPLSHAGWSVLVRGTTRIVDDPGQRTSALRLPLRPWASTHADLFIAVSTDIVTGRRIVPWHRHG